MQKFRKNLEKSKNSCKPIQIVKSDNGRQDNKTRYGV